MNKLPITSITPYIRNPRNNQGAIDAVAKSIKEFGFLQPIVVDNDGIIIIVGHTRYEAAKYLNLTEVPVIKAVNLSEAQTKAYRIADNKTNEYSSWDPELLEGELTSIEEILNSIDITAFTWPEFEALQAEDADIEKEKRPTVKPIKREFRKGDIFLLGDNELVVNSDNESTFLNLAVTAYEQASLFVVRKKQ